MYHPKTWGFWLLAALIPVVLTKNPFYLLVAILAVGVNYLSLGRSAPAAQGWGSFLRLGLILVFFTIAFNLLFVSAGDTVLFTLPELRWRVTTLAQQPVLMQIGGQVTLESLIYGFTTGLALIGVLITFATFNTLVDHYQLLRSIPRFLYQSAIVVSIGITFVPHMVVAQREIREAQALRGHRFRFIRDLPPLFIALLAEGLERSISLAESMDARGFGGQPSSSTSKPGGYTPQTDLLIKSIIALALVILTSGAFALSYFPNRVVGGATMLAGGGILVAALWMVGHNVHRSRYRRDTWRRRDTLVACAAAIAGLVILATWITDRSVFVFYPYPSLDWPDFKPWIALPILLLSMPALASRLTREPLGEVTYD
jgi:energy-coupling factor transport system permease protein